MGYSLWLEDPKTGEICKGGTRQNLGNMICLKGTPNLEFNITYNYALYFYEVEGFEDNGIREIYGLTGEQSKPLLTKLVNAISLKYYNEDKDEWRMTKHKKRVAYKNKGGIRWREEE